MIGGMNCMGMRADDQNSHFITQQVTKNTATKPDF
jgi:hypothetical protein